jgi:hypothetical protein
MHPFVTGNCFVFFQDRTFLEPVTVLDRATADFAAAEGNIFVRRLKRFTERHGEGMAMLALRSMDAEADRTAYQWGGLDAGNTFTFRRRAPATEGASREVGFTLAFAESAAAPDAAFFACQHLNPGALFEALPLVHPNGATGVATVVAVAQTPGDFRDFVATAQGSRGSGSETGKRASGESVRVVSPQEFHARYGLAAPDPRRGLRFAAFEIAVADLATAASFAAGAAARFDEPVVVPPAPGLGVAMAFVGGGDASA